MNAPHQLTTSDTGGHTCTVCGLRWKNVPVSSCPGVKVYSWGKWPEHLLTKKQMADAGLQTGKALPPPAGAVFRDKSPGGVMWLYDKNQGVPKKPITESQKAALEKAKQESLKGWYCQRCGDRLNRFKKGGGLCFICKDREGAIDWAQALLKTEFVIFDSETTGLLAGYDEFVQLAVIDHTGAVLLDTLVKPRHPERMLEQGGKGLSASDIHGMTPESVQDAPGFPDVYPALMQALSGRLVVIYNAAFDIGILDGVCRMHGLPLPELETDCAMNAYAVFVGDWSNYWNDYRWQPLPGGDHTALGDCRATLDVLREMANADE